MQPRYFNSKSALSSNHELLLLLLLTAYQNQVATIDCNMFHKAHQTIGCSQNRHVTHPQAIQHNPTQFSSSVATGA
jgi:hypothetical protein